MPDARRILSAPRLDDISLSSGLFHVRCEQTRHILYGQPPLGGPSAPTIRVLEVKTELRSVGPWR
jgi:hypothetical protein